MTEPPAYDPPSRMWALPSWLTNQAAVASTRQVVGRLAAIGGDRHDFLALSALAEFGPLGRDAMAVRCGATPADVVPILDGLARRGLVRPAAAAVGDGDGSVEVTEAGTAYLDQLAGLLAEAQAAYVAPLDPAEQDQLVTLLTKLVTAHGPSH